ncbi:MFS family permease [Pedobacter sp. UYEF25]
MVKSLFSFNRKEAFYFYKKLLVWAPLTDNQMRDKAKQNRNVIFLVIVAALGYFVDIYDLVLFSVVRVQSLTSIGVSAANLRSEGIHIINYQMFGLLLGGILWGILGDRLGRIKVLFGSILLYSLANIANGFATTVESYSWIRFFAGVGLAGELGAGITLVAERWTKIKEVTAL